MNVREHYNSNKQLYWIFGLLLAGFMITGTILLLRYMRNKRGRMKNKGIQQSTIDFLQKEEGTEYKAYKDTVGLDTIGVGHLIKPGEEYLLTKTLTEKEVDDLLAKDMKTAEQEILKGVKDPDVFTQNEFDALVSLFFNIGERGFETSTLFRELNKPIRDKDKITTAWLAWKYAGGKPMLLERRKREVKLFFQ